MPNNLVLVLAENKKEVVSKLISFLNFFVLLVCSKAMSSNQATLRLLITIIDELLSLIDLTRLVSSSPRIKVLWLLIDDLRERHSIRWYSFYKA